MYPLESDEYRIVSPQGPFALPDGGWMWYRFTGRGADRTSMTESMAALDRLTEAICQDTARRIPTIFVGFSQGATASLAFAAHRPERVEAVVALSGFLVQDSVLPGPLERLKGKRIFMSHGTTDGSIPFSWAESAKERLRAVGASVEFVAHEGGHTVPPTVLKKARDWIREEAGIYHSTRPGR